MNTKESIKSGPKSLLGLIKQDIQVGQHGCLYYITIRERSGITLPGFAQSMVNQQTKTPHYRAG